MHLLQAGVFICFLFLLGGASRLARFNISHDAQPRNPGRPDRKVFCRACRFPPRPVCSPPPCTCSTEFPTPYWWIAIPWLILVGLTAYLMVSTWRFWSAKEINLSRRHPFQLLVLLAVIAYVVLRYSNVRHVRGGAGLHVLGDLGARGLWLVEAPSQKAANCARVQRSRRTGIARAQISD